MAGSITTKEWCAVKDGKAITGQRRDLVNSIFRWGLDYNNVLTVKAKGFNEFKLHSYNRDEWDDDMMCRDIIQVLFRKIKEYGYKLYRDIG